MLFSVAKIGSLEENISYWIQQSEESGAAAAVPYPQIQTVQMCFQ